MEWFLLILGIVFAFFSGFLCNLAHDDDSVSPFGFIVLIFIASLCLGGSIQITKEKNDYIIEALNGTLEYDTVSMDKNGKLVEIKIK